MLGSLPRSQEPTAEGEPGLGIHVPPPRVAHGLDAAVLGAHAPLLEAAAPPGSFLRRTQVPYTAGRAEGPHALARGRHLAGEEEEAHRGPHCWPKAMGEQENETA